MYSNPRVLTYENAPINSGIKSVYPELLQFNLKSILGCGSVPIWLDMNATQTYKLEK